MNLTMKKIVASIGSLIGLFGFFYLLWSFGTFTFNPRDWGQDLRVLYCLLSTCTSILSLLCIWAFWGEKK